MKKLLEDVAAFHNVMGHPVARELVNLDDERFAFRVSLIEDEADELCDVLVAHRFHPTETSIKNIAQEMVDLIYVLVGLALEMGLPLDRVWNEVQAANMRKIDPLTGKVKYREDGKVLKPDGWIGPDIRKAVFGG